MSMAEDEDVIASVTAHYPPADMTPAEFERFVTSLFEGTQAGGAIQNLTIQNHEVIRGADGDYDFDATVRYEIAGGMSFLIVVEAKMHRNPIKRELVQVLHQKMQSVGAQKAVLVSTAPFQSGALAFATTHGIALVTVTEGRFTYETKAAAPRPPLTRAEAFEHFGLPTFVGHTYSQGDHAGTTHITTMSPEYPDLLAKHLLADQTTQ